MLRVGDEISVDEDLHNEFRMHVRNCLSEIPPRCEANYKGKIVRKMQPNSKTICAFLNTEGGRIYLGINDRGIVRGMRMTRMQIINLGDESSETSMKSYVVESDDEDEPIQTHSKGYYDFNTFLIPLCENYYISNTGILNPLSIFTTYH
uniref:AlbA_2 domain-containing protein n=1 Tax=Heterorhabditis bacteriophora TaxID=37862 RepID=A0A1I7WTH1_HETBA